VQSLLRPRCHGVEPPIDGAIDGRIGVRPDENRVRRSPDTRSTGCEFEDLNLRGQIAINNPIKTIWLAVTHGTGGAKPFFFEDMLQLSAQLSGRNECRLPTRDKILDWPSSITPSMIFRSRKSTRILNSTDTHVQNQAVGKS
jgi:hypothetical protein